MYYQNPYNSYPVLAILNLLYSKYRLVHELASIKRLLFAANTIAEENNIVEPEV